MVTPEDEAHKPGDDVTHISGEDVNKPSDLETGGKYDKPDENNKHKVIYLKGRMSLKISSMFLINL